MTAVYGDIGIIGSPSPVLTHPVQGQSGSTTETPLYASERVTSATRDVHITVLPGQSLGVTISPSGVFGGHNADLQGVVGELITDIDTPVAVSLEPGVWDLSVGVQSTQRGGLVAISSVDLAITATPASPLHDISGSAHHATISTIKRAAGLTHRAIEFEGEPDAITIPDLGWRGTDARGVSFWLRDGGDGPLFQFADNTVLELVSGVLTLTYLGTGHALHSTSPTTDDWHHCMVWIEAGTVYAWVDSDLPTETAIAVDTGGSWSMHIGRAGTAYWTGVMDEIVLLDARPDDTELTSMLGRQNPLTGSLYAKRVHGPAVYPVVTGGYPADPVRGQTVVSWDGSAAVLKVYIDGDWRTLT